MSKAFKNLLLVVVGVGFGIMLAVNYFSMRWRCGERTVYRDHNRVTVEISPR
jgi:hypothetical protein